MQFVNVDETISMTRRSPAWRRSFFHAQVQFLFCRIIHGQYNFERSRSEERRRSLQMKRFIERVLAVTCALFLLFGTGITRAEGDAADAAMELIRPEAIRADMRLLPA